MKNIKLLGSAMLVSLALFSQSSLAKEYKIGASLLTQQHPFYIDLANAMKEEAKKEIKREQKLEEDHREFGE